MSRVQYFDSLLYRIITPPVPPPTVPTLAAIYAFGLGDDPFVDNLFATPAGNLRFPGNTSWGSGGGSTSSAVEFYQDKSTVALASPAGYELASIAFNNSGVGGSGCGRFETYEINDPAWNGNFQALAGAIVWGVENVNGSNDPSQATTRSSTTYGRRFYDPNAQSPFTSPDDGHTGFGLQHTLALFNPSVGGVTNVERTTGYGEEEKLLYATRNGANSQWVTHWNNNALVPAAGDGPAWFIDRSGGFGGLALAAAWQAYQRTNDVTKGWGWRLFGNDTAGTLSTILDLTTDGGTLNGATIATLDVGGLVQEAFISDSIDFTVAAGYAMNFPPRAGYVVVATQIRLVLTAASGAIATAPTVKAGNNGAGDNFINTTAGTPSIANANNAIALGVFPYLSTGYNQNSGLANSSLLSLATPITFTVTVAATGAGLVLQGRTVTLCTLAPIASLS